MQKNFASLKPASLLLLVLGLSACGAQEPRARPSAALPQVKTLTVQPRAFAMSTDLPGRIEPVRIAEVRARVAGVVLTRHFQEGSDVKAGQLLFSIDPAPLKAALMRAEGALARVEADVYRANAQVQRFKQLVEISAVSPQAFDEAMSDLKSAQANRLAAQADLTSARLNLDYCQVRAPISGRIGRALVSEGALVGQDEATQMARIQQLDPIYADFTQSADQVVALQQALASGRLTLDGSGAAEVTVQVGNPAQTRRGKLMFSDISVDRSTGQVTLRGEFPNPDNVLLPGMYVRVVAPAGVDPQALFVPQQAVQRGADGQARLMLVDVAGVVRERVVSTGAMFGTDWQITQGLAAGEQVVIERADKLSAGTQVHVVTLAEQQARN
ncbi:MULTISPECIES: efflux RND transporter periplasmic adaptor subunit [Pseudomonas]|uniref:Efflux RND transporter periplasmic adaptor subunit n=1 Tax=Pseudomonas bijieensis TaxID=2681983 RepID=A0A6N1C8J5_9PSED|nr:MULTISPECIES: efflux RND transporter periplasmic adaptor subunit [Pseudomonas]AXP03735.1 efflux RND transporter periplasmic adaptor subunit [Pseudomonas fluorescens]PWJ38866.1 multidrug efflux system membrane fusion protein [Pseudomonas sp. 43mfcvi1.1]QIB08185.1 efflux RND transporter periplasmic adaptor subunit [Pseudomonas fluorescens]QKS80592.1 efflux RND transporter periplasmic adaptor subunit [Pseudomonas bijieensis]UQI28906.1 efflux RND transporter periplasmic adaptor subunit [Pseudom